MWVSGRLDPHESLPSPDLGPGLPPSLLTWGQDPCVQALLQQRPWPRKSIPFLILISFKGSGLEKSDSGVLT